MPQILEGGRGVAGGAVPGTGEAFPEAFPESFPGASPEVDGLI